MLEFLSIFIMILSFVNLAMAAKLIKAGKANSKASKVIVASCVIVLICSISLTLRHF